MKKYDTISEHSRRKEFCVIRYILYIHIQRIYFQDVDVASCIVHTCIKWFFFSISIYLLLMPLNKYIDFNTVTAHSFLSIWNVEVIALNRSKAL